MLNKFKSTLTECCIIFLLFNFHPNQISFFLAFSSKKKIYQKTLKSKYAQISEIEESFRFHGVYIMGFAEVINRIIQRIMTAMPVQLWNECDDNRKIQTKKTIRGSRCCHINFDTHLPSESECTKSLLRHSWPSNDSWPFTIFARLCIANNDFYFSNVAKGKYRTIVQ